MDNYYIIQSIYQQIRVLQQATNRPVVRYNLEDPCWRSSFEGSAHECLEGHLVRAVTSHHIRAPSSYICDELMNMSVCLLKTVLLSLIYILNELVNYTLAMHTVYKRSKVQPEPYLISKRCTKETKLFAALHYDIVIFFDTICLSEKYHNVRT